MTVPNDRVNASDDVIGALSDRVADLSRRVTALGTELEAAQKRLAVYEEFDKTVQEAISGALRAAYQIRERAEATANQILEQAREERRLLLKEVERLRDERDALQEEIAHERRGGIAAVAPRVERPAAEAGTSPELRAVATEALRSMFKDIVDDLVRTAQAQPPAPIAPEPAPPAPRQEPRPEPTVAAAPAVAERPVAPEPPVSAPETARPAATSWPEPTPAPAPPPILYEVPRPVAEPPAMVEDSEIVPQRDEGGTPMAEIQLVLSPVSSFARLVEIERRIQTLPPIRSLYVRDFRGGVATLAVGLRTPMTIDQFTQTLGTLGQPGLRPVSASRNSLELRLEGDASIA